MSVTTECDSLSRTPLRAASGLPTKSGAKFVPRQAINGRHMSSSLQLGDLATRVREFVEENVQILQPDRVHVCDGSDEENKQMVKLLQDMGRLKKLEKYDNCYLVHTSQEDVARVEKQTFVCTKQKEDAVPTPVNGVESKLGNWKDPDEMDKELGDKFRGSMAGRTMYVIPFSMGPLGSNLSKIGIQLTDSEYVVASMRIMTRMGRPVLDVLQNGEFVKCVHSVGYPLTEGQEDVAWPCNKEKLAIVQYPERNEIKSFGSGYGGNSLLGKKCFALRIASTIARDEGWLAEHMLIVGLTNPQGVKRYIAAAFPSACGKTNLAMLTPTLPGWKAECVGDDIAWMRFNEEGQLMAINPENGFFGVAPGTNTSSNPNAMKTICRNTIFTNVAATSDGGVYWEGLEREVSKDVSITSWLGVEDWQNLSEKEKKSKPAAHPNSRFCTPTAQCPIIDPQWEDPRGVPIDAILFGGRRPTTIPLVYEANDWNHGVFVGASMRSEATAAASDVKKGDVLHDPFAMRPFFGYNFSHYLQHWLDLQHHKGAQMPKIFHVNWFRKDGGKFLWPGFGDNIRILDWIFRRCDGEDIAQSSPLGLIPKQGTINTEGLGAIDMARLFELPKEELQKEVAAIEEYFEQQLSGEVPQAVRQQLEDFKSRVESM